MNNKCSLSQTEYIEISLYIYFARNSIRLHPNKNPKKKLFKFCVLIHLASYYNFSLFYTLKIKRSPSEPRGNKNTLKLYNKTLFTIWYVYNTNNDNGIILRENKTKNLRPRIIFSILLRGKKSVNKIEKETKRRREEFINNSF
jgi:hypothetical protein